MNRPVLVTYRPNDHDTVQSIVSGWRARLILWLCGAERARREWL